MVPSHTLQLTFPRGPESSSRGNTTTTTTTWVPNPEPELMTYT